MATSSLPVSNSQVGRIMQPVKTRFGEAVIVRST
jgi:hypothetical protein